MVPAVALYAPHKVQRQVAPIYHTHRHAFLRQHNHTTSKNKNNQATRNTTSTQSSHSFPVVMMDDTFDREDGSPDYLEYKAQLDSYYYRKKDRKKQPDEAAAAGNVTHQATTTTTNNNNNNNTTTRTTDQKESTGESPAQHEEDEEEEDESDEDTDDRNTPEEEEGNYEEDILYDGEEEEEEDEEDATDKVAQPPHEPDTITIENNNQDDGPASHDEEDNTKQQADVTVADDATYEEEATDGEEDTDEAEQVNNEKDVEWTDDRIKEGEEEGVGDEQAVEEEEEEEGEQPDAANEEEEEGEEEEEEVEQPDAANEEEGVEGQDTVDEPEAASGDDAASKLMSLDFLLKNASALKILQPRRHVVELLRAADPNMLLEPDTLSQLPTWQQISDLYYSGNGRNSTHPTPVVYGMETCAQYRQTVALKDRFLAVAGLFNTGTNAMTWTLDHNIHLPGYHHSTRWQVPWGKHRLATVKWTHTAPDGMGKFNKTNVLPIVIIKDPFYWLQSMCKSPYEASWKHHDAHCPNLVPNDYDQAHFFRSSKGHIHPHNQNASIPIRIEFDSNSSVTWPSLIHLWNDWYQLYLQQLPDKAPRLMVRFEDTLFAPREVLQHIAQCVLGPAEDIVKHAETSHLGWARHTAALFNDSAPLRQQTSTSKDHGSQTDLVHALIKYGSGRGRLSNMTSADLQFARQTLDTELMRLFQYQLPKESAMPTIMALS